MELPDPPGVDMSLAGLLAGAGTTAGMVALLVTAPGRAPGRPLVSVADAAVGLAVAGTSAPEGAWSSTATAPEPASRRRRLLTAAAAAAIVAVIAPPLVLPLAIAAWAATTRRASRARRRVEHEIRIALPDAVDLLLLCCGAGLSLPLAHAEVAERVPGPLGHALRRADAATRSGHPRADALATALAPLGDRAAGLADALVDHLRYGSPLLPGLERLSGELRLDRRRHAEESARRVPVRLLGPLIACTLPAFGVLTVVPLVAASLRALPT